MNKNSYTAANSIPIKLLLNPQWVREGKITPIHAQFMPTYKCNFSCSFCSCSKRNKDDEMSFDKVKLIINNLKIVGCKAVTITGGGEPLCHPQINQIIELFNHNNIKVGLATNGSLLNSKFISKSSSITWCRISASDNIIFNSSYCKKLEEVFNEYSNINWAFSYVVSEVPNEVNIANMVKFANKNNITHIRLVSDLFKSEKVNLDKISLFLREKKVDDSLVIYQHRQNYTRGGTVILVF
jgi:organic radical activating enzyme